MNIVQEPHVHVDDLEKFFEEQFGKRPDLRVSEGWHVTGTYPCFGGYTAVRGEAALKVDSWLVGGATYQRYILANLIEVLRDTYKIWPDSLNGKFYVDVTW